MNAARIARTAGVLLVVGALSGCGSDNPLSSSNPDASQLAPPSNLRFSGSLLTWNPSPDAKTVGYDIEADLSDPQVVFVRVNPRMQSIPAYDLAASQPEFVNTWYRVRAVNAAGGRSAPSNSVYVTANAQSTGALMPDDPGIVDTGPVNP